MADYSFRAVTGNDLTMLSGWLQQLQVRRWWRENDELDQIRAHIADPAISPLIVSRGDDPIAYVQHYSARRWPAPQFAHLPHDTVALDLFSGPMGFGHGASWLRQLGDDLLGRVSMLATDPTTDNVAAVRAYRKAGFDGDVIRPDADGKPVLVMTRRR
ncbi:GNAT family N-acetyltransferase [Paracoccus xiamenensis]|uniref:GNAT family N-acetyltransferase n=1 Tax=Paracoccus xiamenensis TaxID=2714901 RepID=UPI001409F508|nr:GNAT family N-acetyltransferase [Paracoccus xiamenensis]NHF73612.1 acetyltransferase [Paracoccus xiamenensis]